MHSPLRGRIVVLALLAFCLSAIWPVTRAAASDPSREGATWTLEHHPSISAPAQPLAGPVALVLDDGSREVDLGFNSTTAFQFLWFNRFAAPAPGFYFSLSEIQVLFPPGPDVVPGAAIELVVFTDLDGNPATGASLVAAWDDVVQVADGTTFSVYNVDPPLLIPPNSGDVLIGVVNRFVISGVSAPSRPAALDTNGSAGRSWVALWTGDPPDPPVLPSDDVLDLVDVIEPGNWMIRASGEALSPLAIPTLSGWGMGLLATLLALGGVAYLRRP